MILKYADTNFLEGKGRYILIGGITAMSIFFLLAVFIIFFALLTEKICLIEQIVDRNQGVKDGGILSSYNSIGNRSNVASSYSPFISSNVIRN